MSICKTTSHGFSITAYESNFNPLSLSTIPISRTLVILLVEPMILPEIHTTDGFQQWKMRGERPKRKGKCPERISPDWIYTKWLQDDPGGAISVIADVFHKE